MLKEMFPGEKPGKDNFTSQLRRCFCHWRPSLPRPQALPSDTSHCFIFLSYTNSPQIQTDSKHQTLYFQLFSGQNHIYVMNTFNFYKSNSTFVKQNIFVSSHLFSITERMFTKTENISDILGFYLCLYLESSAIKIIQS